MVKQYSKEWWGALMRQLMGQGYIAENIRDLYKTYAVSPKGLKWTSYDPPPPPPSLRVDLLTHAYRVHVVSCAACAHRCGVQGG